MSHQDQVFRLVSGMVEKGAAPAPAAPAPLAPFEEDSAVSGLAHRLGMALNRVEGIEVYDEQALVEAGLMRQSPDYPRIRKAMRAGKTVQGARYRGVEYILRRGAKQEGSGE